MLGHRLSRVDSSCQRARVRSCDVYVSAPFNFSSFALEVIRSFKRSLSNASSVSSARTFRPANSPPQLLSRSLAVYGRQFVAFSFFRSSSLRLRDVSGVGSCHLVCECEKGLAYAGVQLMTTTWPRGMANWSQSGLCVAMPMRFYV